MVYSALLDANVLHPQILCDLLRRLAEHDLFRPLWSAKILAETVESIARRRPDLDPRLLRKRMDAMNEAFPDACVSGFEHLVGTMPEMGEDAHVLAAALFSKADVIVTNNVKDFPPRVAPRFKVDVKTADQFLVQQWWLEPRLVARVILEQADGTRRPHFDLPRLLRALGRVVLGNVIASGYGLPHTGYSDRLRARRNAALMSPALGALVSSGQQKDQLPSTLLEIHPIAGTDIDSQFGDALTNRRDISVGVQRSAVQVLLGRAPSKRVS